jgi:Cu-Zn family superoxide dismutase
MKKTILGLGAAAVVLAGCATMETPGPSATAVIRPASGSQVHGEVTFTQVAANRVRVTGEIAGHASGPKGFHIHEKGDCSAPDAMSAGGHFNPNQRAHGATPMAGHTGDMGNLTFNENGKATVDMVLDGLTVMKDAPNSIVGRAVVVHMSPDDLKTDPTGNAGARAACGVIS